MEYMARYVAGRIEIDFLDSVVLKKLFVVARKGNGTEGIPGLIPVDYENGLSQGWYAFTTKKAASSYFKNVLPNIISNMSNLEIVEMNLLRIVTFMDSQLYKEKLHLSDGEEVLTIDAENILAEWHRHKKNQWGLPVKQFVFPPEQDSWFGLYLTSPDSEMLNSPDFWELVKTESVLGINPAEELLVAVKSKYLLDVLLPEYISPELLEQIEKSPNVDTIVLFTEKGLQYMPLLVCLHAAKKPIGEILSRLFDPELDTDLNLLFVSNVGPIFITKGELRVRLSMTPGQGIVPNLGSIVTGTVGPIIPTHDLEDLQVSHINDTLANADWIAKASVVSALIGNIWKHHFLIEPTDIIGDDEASLKRFEAQCIDFVQKLSSELDIPFSVNLKPQSDGLESKIIPFRLPPQSINN